MSDSDSSQGLTEDAVGRLLFGPFESNNDDTNTRRCINSSQNDGQHESTNNAISTLSNFSSPPRVRLSNIKLITPKSHSKSKSKTPSSSSSSSSSQQKPPLKKKAKTFNSSNNNNNDDEQYYPFFSCEIYDGKYTENVFVYIDIHKEQNNKIQQQLENNNETNTPIISDLIIFVDGYITSKTNYKPRWNKHGILINTIPFFCITNFRICQYCCSFVNNVNNTVLLSTENNDQQDKTKVNKTKEKKLSSPSATKGGIVGTFLEENLSFLTDNELIGLSTNGVFEDVIDERCAMKVADFISHHRANLMLSLLGRRSTCTDTVVDETEGKTEESSERNNNDNNNYTRAISEFNSAQLKRQSASLVTNAGREDAQTSERIVKQHYIALDKALEHASTTQQELSKDLLCQWHKDLGDDIIQNAGHIREKQVRAGPTSFTHYSLVGKELDTFCANLRILEKRLFASSGMFVGKEQQISQFGLAPILFASVALFGVVDIHPFNDGNGRLARLVANWALRRSGLPFAISICATPVQRAEYIKAIELTRRNLCLVSIGTSHEMFALVRSCVGLFKPMADMILDRVYRAVVQCQAVINEHSARQSEEEEARAARRYRENAAKGTCLICFDDNPNIATLCCGKAVHINCIAEWLSAKNSCPNCRGNLPLLSRGVATATVNNQDIFDVRIRELEAHINELSNEASVDDTTISVSEDDPRVHATTDDTIDVTFDDTTESVTEDLETNPTPPDDTTSEFEEDTTEAPSNVNEQFDDTTESVEEDHAASPDDTTSVFEEDTTEAPTDVNEQFDDTTESVTEDHAALPDDTTSVLEHTTSDYSTTDAVETEDTETNTHDQESTTNVTSCQEIDDTTSESTGFVAPRPQQSNVLYCGQSSCGNRAAVDCEHGFCGRCCVIYGYRRCSRHGT